MIGVASTSIPFSCAYCKDCAERGADPKWVLSYFIDEVAGGDLSKLRPEALTDLNTYHEGRYISLQEWAKIRPRDENDKN